MAGAGRQDQCGAPAHESPSCPLPREPCPGCRPLLTCGSERASRGTPRPGRRPRSTQMPGLALPCAEQALGLPCGPRGRGVAVCHSVGSRENKGRVFCLRGPLGRAFYRMPGSRERRASSRGWSLRASGWRDERRRFAASCDSLGNTPGPRPFVLAGVGTIQELTHFKNGRSASFSMSFCGERWERFILKTTCN